MNYEHSERPRGRRWRRRATPSSNCLLNTSCIIFTHTSLSARLRTADSLCSCMLMQYNVLIRIVFVSILHTMFRRQALGLKFIKPHVRTFLPGRRWCTSGATESERDKMERLLAMELPTNDGSPNLLKIRHTASHVLAMAVQNLYPTVKVTIGPWIESGLVLGHAKRKTGANFLSSIVHCLDFTMISTSLENRFRTETCKRSRRKWTGLFEAICPSNGKRLLAQRLSKLT